MLVSHEHLLYRPVAAPPWHRRRREKLTETLDANRKQALRESEIKRVNVDTMVQEKAIALPTDAHLYHKARHALVRAAQGAGIPLRQAYVRLGRQALAAGALHAGPAGEAGAA